MFEHSASRSRKRLKNGTTMFLINEIMGHDKLSIVRFNSSRRGLSSLPNAHRSPYLERILEASSLEICLLPDDDKTVSMNAVMGYGQYKVPSADGTVLLFDNNRVRMRSPNVSLNAFGPLPGLDMDNMVCPGVEVMSLTPSGNQSVLKEFSMVTWKYTMSTETKVKIETLAENLILFSPRLAMSTGKPVLVRSPARDGNAWLSAIDDKWIATRSASFVHDERI